jgi:arylsulfatase A-like enzyme
MKTSGIIELFLIGGTIGTLSQCQNMKDIKKPNILFIITDDQSPFSLKAYGNQICQTPNIDKLASEGITVTSAYVQGSWMSAVSVPSRTQLMTGRNVWRTVGLPGFKTPGYESPVKANEALRPEDPQFYSMPAVFNRAGYVTFRTCKSSTSYVNATSFYL